jgi:predicted Na+-dependent transporter
MAEELGLPKATKRNVGYGVGMSTLALGAGLGLLIWFYVLQRTSTSIISILSTWTLLSAGSHFTSQEQPAQNMLGIP